MVWSAALLACSGTGETIEQDAATTPDVNVADRGVADAVGLPDTTAVDYLPETSFPELFFDLPDFAPEIPRPQCAQGEGCFLDGCQGNADCLSGWCVQHLGQSVCSQACQEECPQGWSCKQVAGTDPDVVYICVSNYANLCRPCDSNSDCLSAGGAQDACIDYGTDGDFCGGPCGSTGQCPWGFSCKEVASVDGATLTQCVNDTGECPCTASSVAVGLSTSCSVSNELGTCLGKRICGDEGLSECTATIPAAEACNGLDDDCDGEVDEPNLLDGQYVLLCDDQNQCTGDKCSGEQGCVNDLLESGDCNDGNPCTVADHCEEGACVGDPVQCDDENPCTENVCTDTGGCKYLAVSGPCDDEDPCTVGDQCVDSACTGTPISCDCQNNADCELLEDADLCNGTLFCDLEKFPYQCSVDPATVVVCPEPQGTGSICLATDCDPDTGQCSFVPANDGLLCDDADMCTTGAICTGGECSGAEPVNCNDGNLCTDDSCDSQAGCQHLFNSASCSDGDACTLDDQCTDGQCKPAGALVCDDDNVCNGVETCDSQTGCKSGTPLSCGDDNVCNGQETCNPKAGCISGPPQNCNDGNPCTNDACDPEEGCVYTFNQAPCSDADACTIGDHCSDGQCGATQLLKCDDANPCTDDSCDNMTGCTHTPNQLPCDDANACTETDLCIDGKCIGGDMLPCDDGNVCTTDSCTADLGCTHVLNAAPCDDNDICTIADHCHLGECLGGNQLPCNDGNPCTTDSCQPQGGCQFIPADEECSDGSKCTTGDHCLDGVCVITGFVDCEDDNPCTDDSCDPKVGCVNTANQAPCTDGTVCTLGDQCVQNVCVPGVPLVCDDSNLCTDDSCDPQSGCVFAHNTIPCNDSNLCTPFDKCTGGACVGSGAVDCDDDNLCTDDACDPDLGCVNEANSQPCSDEDECTAGDVCLDKSCASGAPLDCDDSNMCTLDDCAPDTGCSHVPLGNGEDCGGGKICWNGECSTPCIPGSHTFNYTGGQQSFQVPNGCESITVDAYGGKGGCGEGGDGGRAKGIVPVTSGETVYVFVGGQGQCNSAVKSGAYNGGGATVPSNGYTNGEGAGASDVRRGGTGLGNRVLVAGGGGGRGWGGLAGDGGGDVGQAADTAGGGCGGPCNGKGGTQSAGGEGGHCGGSCWGTDGTLGKGGTAAACSASGGGGGGGYYGGGGGGHCSGGGGSSYFAPGVAKQNNDQGVNAGAGKIIISW